MIKTPILSGLFVLKNNRTIREPKKFSGRVGKAIVQMCIFPGGYGWHRKLEGSFAPTVMCGTRVNGLISSGTKTAGQIGDLGGNFSHHYFFSSCGNQNGGSLEPCICL